MDSTRARMLLGWRPRLSLTNAVEITADWYRAFYESRRILTDEQIAHYQDVMESEVHT